MPWKDPSQLIDVVFLARPIHCLANILRLRRWILPFMPLLLILSLETMPVKMKQLRRDGE